MECAVAAGRYSIAPGCASGRWARGRDFARVGRGRANFNAGITGVDGAWSLWDCAACADLAGSSFRAVEDEHIEAILAHELMHVRRRDNLIAMLHMGVEAVFWFHPLVWWMERRMVEERERACDEAVVQMGGKPEIYAESLLKACRFCLESPLTCIAGVTGADLKSRIRSIMTPHLAKLTLSRKIVLVIFAITVVAVPVAFGIVRMIPMYGQILHATAPLPSFEVATIKLQKPVPLPPPGEEIIHQETITGGLPGGFVGGASDRVHMTMTTNMLIATAYNISGSSQSRIVGGPAWQNADRYEIQAKVDDSMNAAMQKMSPAQRREQVELMEQSLLADRFKLKVHFETQEMQAYALVVGKGQPKLTAAKDGEAMKLSVIVKEGESELTATAVTIDQLVHSPFFAGNPALGGHLVVDRTDIKGAYDFTLKWGSEQPAGIGQEDRIAASPLFVAIQQQLGLKLNQTKGPVEVLVIDSIERPSEN
jgi:bla regulator protein BlaR1